MSKQLIAIWAEAHNHVIGKNHTMPWHLPAELAHFKKTTMGSAILMGRVTFDGMNGSNSKIRTSILLVVLVSTRLLMDVMMHSSRQLLRLI